MAPFLSEPFYITSSPMKMSDEPEALTCFQKALEIEPNNAEYINLVGHTYDELGDLKEAEKYLRRSLELKPDYAHAYNDLGDFLMKDKNRRKEGRLCYERAIELDPEMAVAYYSLACCHALEGNKKEALKQLKLALEKGFCDRGHINSDSDMDSLRQEPGFKELMKQYFGEAPSRHKQRERK